ncbi:MAG: Phosphatidate cytidylyltransferase CdsA [Clostridiales bacterium 38_11]|nr:MAG: Phosphatidate cytidylyltransferase CdsA [Clostridiales bacterium 38_11]HBH12864.1 phosphatidate cytidylyltransferase [Clostridiales bacterium]
MKKRVLTGLIGGFYIGLATYLGGALFSFTVLGITLIALFEMDQAVNKKTNIIFKLNYITAIIIFSLLIFSIDFNLYMLITAHTVMAGIIFVVHEGTDFRDLSVTFFGFAYIVLLFYHFVVFSAYQHFWLVYAITFSADSFAYLIGSNFGKHKLCPRLSPKKSIEGAVGGIFGAIIVSLTVNAFLLKEPTYLIIIIALIGSIASIFGDLLASKIKREFSIKDYSNVLPGHGGILDRFDSVLLMTPITYYLVMILLF